MRRRLCINAPRAHTLCVCVPRVVAQFVLLKTGAFCWRSFTPAAARAARGRFYRARADAHLRRPGGARPAIDVTPRRRRPISAACVRRGCHSTRRAVLRWTRRVQTVLIVYNVTVHLSSSSLACPGCRIDYTSPENTIVGLPPG